MDGTCRCPIDDGLPATAEGLLALWPHTVTWVERQKLTSSVQGERVYGVPLDVEDWELVQVELFVEVNSDTLSAFTWNLETCIEPARPKWDAIEGFGTPTGVAGDATMIQAGGPTSQVPVRKWLRWWVERAVGFEATLVFSLRYTFKRRAGLPVRTSLWLLTSTAKDLYTDVHAPVAGVAAGLRRTLATAMLGEAEVNHGILDSAKQSLPWVTLATVIADFDSIPTGPNTEAIEMRGEQRQHAGDRFRRIGRKLEQARTSSECPGQLVRIRGGDRP